MASPAPALTLSCRVTWGGPQMEVKVFAQSGLTLRPHGLPPSRLLCPWDFPDKNTGDISHSLLQGILLTQGSNPGLLHRRQIPYHLSHQGR